MTPQAFKKLAPGTKVYWKNEPQAGTVVRAKDGLRIEWLDGQVTYSFDDWALKNVHTAAEAPHA